MPFAKYDFKGSNVIFLIFISTIMLPLEVLMIPIFQTVKAFGLYNTLAGVYHSSGCDANRSISGSSVLFVCAGWINGGIKNCGAKWVPDHEKCHASNCKSQSSVCLWFLTLCGVGMTICGRWFVLRSSKLYTVQLALKSFSGEFSVDWNGLLAMSVITMVPVLVIFLIFQKQFIQGIATSGLKE